MRDGRWRRLWRRSRYHLNGLVLLAPLALTPVYLADQPVPGLGARVLPERAVGPFTVTLAEVSTAPPRTDHDGGRVKDYAARFCDGGRGRIRTAVLHVGAVPPEQPGEDILHGNPARLHAHVPFPETVTGDQGLWLTVETWDGQVFAISWPLAEAARSALPERGD
ncbi:hypothetical protein PQJ75_20175 [Rhodoplanes sp. TEM]|nr:hypothetical protein [Rhodoplanes tepidamans]MDC7986053.1 hypothetical protein [Rhodoplanes sp. TEM]MDQ0353906.1 hypothetical protein [Rhodoplanes tepidamans]